MLCDKRGGSVGGDGEVSRYFQSGLTQSESMEISVLSSGLGARDGIIRSESIERIFLSSV